jgi:hypothetical protein
MKRSSLPKHEKPDPAFMPGGVARSAKTGALLQYLRLNPIAKEAL